MSNFGFGEMFSNVSRSVLSAAVNSALNTATRVLDPMTVHEINGKSNLEEVAQYPILVRVTPLILHGPVETSRFSLPTPAYHIILHVPNSQKMFCMFKSDNRTEAEHLFSIYRESFPLLALIDPTICESDKLDKMAKKLRENQGWSAPHLAASFGLITCLQDVRMKAKLNEQEGVDLRTPLLVAIHEGNVQSISTLLAAGVDPAIADLKDNTIFHLGAIKSPQIFHMLLEKVSVENRKLLDCLNRDGLTPLHIACTNNKVDSVKDLLDAGANSNISSPSVGKPIHCAVKANSLSCMQELIGRDPRQLHMEELQDGGSPIHMALGPDILVPLLEVGCDPNAFNNEGYTALHNAVRRGCLKSTLSLLCHGAYPDIKGGQNDETPLIIASTLCSKLVMQALIAFGADINMKNKLGESPRHLVAKSLRSDRDEVLFVLSAAGALRCDERCRAVCVDGCKDIGTFDGTPPSNFPQHGAPNLMNELLNSFSIQLSVRDRVNSQEKGGGQNNGEPAGGGRLLCLDGGGIRGIVLTQMLCVIEQEVGMPILDLFDWIAGTSTGGILALGLACGKSPLETQCIYMRLKDKVFVGERPYSASVMEEFLKKEFGNEKTLGDIQRPKLMIMTAMVDRRPVDLHIFRNYLSPSVMIGGQDILPHDYNKQYVWEAAKVTGAAPSYFRLDHQQLVDGGLISNNPTLDAMTELHQYNCVMKSMGSYRVEEKLATTVVSLGTGIPPKSGSHVSLLDITWPSGVFDAITKVPKLANLVNLLIDQATQSEGQVVERSRAWCSSIGVPFFRFSPQMITDVNLDEKDDEKLVQLLWETRVYMMANRDSIIEMKRTLLDAPLPSQNN